MRYTYDVLREYIFWVVQVIFVANVSKNSFDLVRLGLLCGVDIVVARVRVVKLVKVVHVVVVVRRCCS